MDHPRGLGPPIGSPDWIRLYGLSARVVCRKAQLEIAHRDERVFSLEGDLALAAVPFDRELPGRFLQLGVAEADLVGTAVGLALRGKIPFVNSFASFLSMRACEQVRLGVAYHRANVKLVGYYCGLTGGWAGSTHHCVEDLAILRAIPNMVVLAPADAVETYKATWAVAAYQGPVYMRVGRAETPQVYADDYEFVLGRAVELRPGMDLTIVAAGNGMVSQALEAAELLRDEGLESRVLNMHTIKPLDREAVSAAARQTRAIVTAEDHNVVGGLGEAVAEAALQEAAVPVVRVGVPDLFCEEADDFERLLPRYGMDAHAIAAAGRQALALAARGA